MTEPLKNVYECNDYLGLLLAPPLAGHSEYVSESTMSTVMFSVFFTCGEFLTYPHCYVYFIIIFLFCNQERIVSVNNFFQFTIFYCEKQTLF